MTYFIGIIAGFLLGMALTLIWKNRPLLVHAVIIALWVFTTPMLKLVSASFIITSLLIYTFKPLPGAYRPGWALIFAGSAIFICRTLATLYRGNIDFALFQDLGSGAPHCLLWALLICVTLRSPREVLQFLVIFGVFRILECGVLGLLGYLYNDQFIAIRLAYRVTPYERDLEIQSLLVEQSRLIGFTITNSVDTAFHLVMSLIFLLAALGRRFSLLFLVMSLVAITAAVLTWARTGVVGLVLAAVFSALFSNNKSRSKIIVGILLAGPLLYFGMDLMRERLDTDSRLLSSLTIDQRFDTMKRWLTRIPEAGMFGLGTPDQIEGGMELSSENIIIQTIMQTGILGGVCYCFLVLWSIGQLFQVVFLTTAWKENVITRMAIMAVLCGLMVGFILANTFFVSYREPIFWLLFAMAHLLRSQLYKSYSGQLADSSQIGKRRIQPTRRLGIA